MLDCFIKRGILTEDDREEQRIAKPSSSVRLSMSFTPSMPSPPHGAAPMSSSMTTAPSS